MLPARVRDSVFAAWDVGAKGTWPGAGRFVFLPNRENHEARPDDE
jgi:hypothetical protein